MPNDIQDFLKAGNDILNSVSSAIDRNDYSTLHDDVNRAIKSVSIDRKTTYSSKVGRQAPASSNSGTPRTTRMNATGAPRTRVYPFFQKKISRYLGVPQMFAAGAFGGFIAMSFLGALITGSLAGSIVLGLITATCGLAFFKGLQKYKLAKKYYQYGNVLKDAEYFSIKDLAKATLSSDKQVLKDIKAMIKAGFLPRARLDNAESTCMITDRAYDQYLGAEKDRQAREAREAEDKKRAVEEAKARNEEYAGLPAKAVEILEEGREYIVFVRQINDVIPDTEELSNKLYRLEEIMNKIFAQVKKDPSSADELHKLMNYYLPTTKKLLNAYVELDKVPEVGDNITRTKNEIDEAIDTINTAFESLLDSMFQDMAWDISSDISVMKTMMAQDGLTVEGKGVTAQVQPQAQGTVEEAQGPTLSFDGQVMTAGGQAMAVQSQGQYETVSK